MPTPRVLLLKSPVEQHLSGKNDLKKSPDCVILYRCQFFQGIFFDEIFEYYFEEMKSYAEKGYSVPKFYAWAKFENENYQLKELINYIHVTVLSVKKL